MTVSDPKLWIGDSHTLDRPNESDSREVFGSVEDDEDTISLSLNDAI